MRDLHGSIRDRLDALKVKRIGVAVSGGSDSLALLTLLKECQSSLELCAATVDHGLREGSANEAAEVARYCEKLGVPHEILKWDNRTKSGNLQENARNARYDLLADWAKSSGLGAVALGHTINDQAETFLMRLVRQSGVDGLSAMPEFRTDRATIWWRPLLSHYREDLRDYLTNKGVTWADDPSNFDRKFERIRMREAMPELSELGLGAATLSAVAKNMALAKSALQTATQSVAKDIVTGSYSQLDFDLEKLRGVEPEIARRLLSAALKWVSGRPHGPRRKPLMEFLGKGICNKAMTLHGCQIVAKDGALIVTREHAAVVDKACALNDTWDHYWSFEGHPNGQETKVLALGPDGLKQCPEWRDTGLSRAALIASPAVWEGERVISAPQAGLVGEFPLKRAPDINDFYTSLISR